MLQLIKRVEKPKSKMKNGVGEATLLLNAMALEIPL